MYNFKHSGYFTYHKLRSRTLHFCQILFHVILTTVRNYFPVNINRLLFVIEIHCFYCEVRNGFLNFLELQASHTFQKDKRANAGGPETNECSFANQEAMGKEVLLMVFFFWGGGFIKNIRGALIELLDF